MITREKALELAMAKIRTNWAVRDDEPVIADEATREENFGWVFSTIPSATVNQGIFGLRSLEMVQS